MKFPLIEVVVLEQVFDRNHETLWAGVRHNLVIASWDRDEVSKILRARNERQCLPQNFKAVLEVDLGATPFHFPKFSYSAVPVATA